MMTDERLSSVLPASMRKDVVAVRHEVPVRQGQSRTVVESYYTPRVIHWALARWLDSVPAEGNLAAVRNAVPVALSDPESFHSYLEVPDAFLDAYEDELRKLEEHKADVDRLKRVLPGERRRLPRDWQKTALWTALTVSLALNFAALWMR